MFCSVKRKGTLTFIIGNTRGLLVFSERTNQEQQKYNRSRKSCSIFSDVESFPDMAGHFNSVRGSNRELIEKSMKGIKSRMEAIGIEIKKAKEKEIEFKEELDWAKQRHREASSKRIFLMDKIEKAENKLNKLESKIGYVKEKYGIVERRLEENERLINIYSKNRPNLQEAEEKLEIAKEQWVENTKKFRKAQKQVEILTAKVDEAENRYNLARDAIARTEEKIRTRQSISKSVYMNWTPKPDKVLEAKVNNLRATLMEKLTKAQRFEKKAHSLDKKVGDIELSILKLKRRKIEVEHSKHELSGCRL